MTIGKRFTRAERATIAEKVLRLKAEGLSRAIIAERCGCGVNLVSVILREAMASGFESDARAFPVEA
jgi:DNA-binding CsgD family transcriptional regulator